MSIIAYNINYQKLKRLFDFTFSIVLILSLSIIILTSWILASIDTRSNGFFFQTRVGRSGQRFNIMKIKTMRPVDGVVTSVTQAGDPRITKLGQFFRKTKLDELPQLFNVLVGDMSFVGPRPDVPGFADRLNEFDKSIILSVRPGITGPASLAYRNEEELLAMVPDPEKYNSEIIYPDKVRINIDYVTKLNFYDDLIYIYRTVWK